MLYVQACFNSTLVQLKVFSMKDTKFLNSMFQFYLSSIKSKHGVKLENNTL